MQEFQFDRSARTPLVSAVVVGPKGARRLTLVFDTGAVLTQIHAPTLAVVGFGASSKLKDIEMIGASGERQKGTLYKCEKLHTFGKRMQDVPIGAFDFTELSRAGIDGLLGWDLIKEFDLDLRGRDGVLRVY